MIFVVLVALSDHVAKSCDGDTTLSEHVVKSSDDIALLEHIVKVRNRILTAVV